MTRFNPTILGGLLLLAAACGADRSRSDGALPRPVAPQVVKAAAGGTVRDDATELVIPASALSADTEVEVRVEPANTFPTLVNGRPEVLVLEPEGTELLVPATIHGDATWVEGVEGELSAAQLREVDGALRWVPLEAGVRLESGGGWSLEVERFAPVALVVTPPATPPSGGAIRGLLTWRDGTPVAGAPVQLLRDSVALRELLTGTDGTFEVSQLEAGVYVVKVDYECQVEASVTVEAAQAAELTLVLCGG